MHQLRPAQSCLHTLTVRACARVQGSRRPTSASSGSAQTCGLAQRDWSSQLASHCPGTLSDTAAASLEMPLGPRHVPLGCPLPLLVPSRLTPEPSVSPKPWQQRCLVQFVPVKEGLVSSKSGSVCHRHCQRCPWEGAALPAAGIFFSLMLWHTARLQCLVQES